MAGKAFDKIMNGLADAVAYAEGDKSRGKANEVRPMLEWRALGQSRMGTLFRLGSFRGSARLWRSARQ